MNDVSVIRVSRCGIIRGTLSGKHVLTLIWMIMTSGSFKIVSNWAVLTEALALPLLSGSAQWVWWGMQLSGWHEAYTFAYQPMTEQYKVVHLPCYLDRSGGFNAVQVFALGKAAARRWWRDVREPLNLILF